MNSSNEESNMSQMVWQSQSLEAPRISLEFVRLQVEKLQAKFRWEYRAIWGVSIIVAILFATVIYPSWGVPMPRLMVVRLGGFLVLAGTLLLTYLTHRRVKALMIDKGEQVLQSLEAYRAVLQQHRDHHLGTWPGVLWVMGPAMLVLFGGIVYDERPNKLLRYTFIFLWFFFGMLWVAKYSKRKARQFQRELDALATMDIK